MKESIRIPITIPIRQVIAVLLLLAGLIFVFVQKSAFLASYTYIYNDKLSAISQQDREELYLKTQEDPTLRSNEINYRFGYVPEDPKKRISMKGTETVTQEFVAADTLIKSANLVFANPTGYKGKGKVDVYLKDISGHTLGTASLDTRMIVNNATTVFSFGGDSEAKNKNHIVSSLMGNREFKGIEVDRGRKYHIVIQSEGVDVGKDDFALYLFPYDIDDDLELLAGDQKLEDHAHVFMGVRYNSFSIPIFSALVAFFILGIIISLMPWHKVEEKIRSRYPKYNDTEIDLNCLFSRIMFFATPFVIDYFIDKVTGYSMVSCIQRMLSFAGFLNLFIIAMVVWGCYAITNRIRPAIIIPTFLFFAFAMANYCLLQFRGSPLVATDFAQVGTAMDVAASYELNMTKAGIWLISIALVWISVALSFEGHKGLSLKNRMVGITVFVLWVASFYNMFFVSDMLSDHNLRVSGFNPNANYKMHGYTLGLTITLTASRAEKPDGYSIQAMKKITDPYVQKADGPKPGEKAAKTSPNFIMVMNEAYSDLRVIKDFETNEEFMPFFKSLKENTIRGWMHTSVFGGSTANTEFEFLTGFTTAFLPYRTVPYSNMMRTETPSLIWNQKARGYGGNIAFHPGEKNSYNRDNVYPFLGFDKHVALEDMNKPQKVRDYVSDAADFQRVIQEYENYKKKGGKAPFDLFNVTIQNHSGYAYSTGKLEPVITISNESLRQEQAEQYLNLIRITDDAFKELVTYFAKVKEPTVIVMFGDHQPRVEDEFYDTLYGKSNLDEGDIDQKHQVPFVIWANYDIKEEKDVQISANYLSSYLLAKTGGQLSPYNEFLLDMYKKIPVLTTICYYDSKGLVHDIEEPDVLVEELQKYKMVEYNGFIDTKHRIKDFFYLK